ncbi:hypothetical protein FQA47_019794 [Oryzias melastigma]|uniref:Uncharacterized protein n=1 Tax=Oryzias melastigma TaxID=30732 RepID=A0A834F339_ORYME|nr:hypothetical protein FQA47_019794 [Oryzias melastigma]
MWDWNCFCFGVSEDEEEEEEEEAQQEAAASMTSSLPPHQMKLIGSADYFEILNLEAPLMERLNPREQTLHPWLVPLLRLLWLSG